MSAYGRDSAPRHPAAEPVRRLRVARTCVLPRLPRLADPAGAAALRPLRLSRRLAGAAVCRVRRPEDRVRDRARGDRLRRHRPAVRPGVEGAGAASARSGGGSDHRRDTLAPSRPGACVRSVRRRPRTRSGTPAGRGARSRARACLGAAGCTAHRSCALGRSPAGPRVAGASAERSRRVRLGASVAATRLPRRRRLHERRNCRGGRLRAAPGRRSQGGGDHARAGRALRGARAPAATADPSAVG